MQQRRVAQNAVEIRGLHFSYGDLLVLRGLSLDIPRGQVVAILGGSGSGKSTLLKLIGGQLRPDQGTVKVDGKDVHQLSSDELYQLRLQIGMMFQTSGLFSDLSVYENVAFPIRENFDVPEELVQRLVLMKLHAVGLRGARAMMPGDLSGGMTRRVALARAIATDPKLMIYDEPFAGLDPISLTQIVGLIRDLNQAAGLTSIVVTYDVHEVLIARRLCLRDRRWRDPRQGNFAGGRDFGKTRICTSSSMRCPTGRSVFISPGRHWKRTFASMAEEDSLEKSC